MSTLPLRLPARSPKGASALQVHPTRRCNLACRHCYTASGPDVDEQLPISLLRAAVDDAAALGFGVLAVSGGEPFLYRPLPALLAAGRGAGMVTAVTTNGMPLTSGKALDLVGLVDLVTFSLDGPPEAHALMRGSARAFPGMVEGVAAVRDAGIPFGFLFTLTRRNVADLVWVATFAAEQGAALLQVHPLDLQGRAAVEMQGEDPDVLELAVAQLLSRELGDGEVVVDVMTRQALLARPEVFLADSQVPDGRLGDWLPSLVVRADGLVIPCSHDVDHGFALGCLKVAPLSELAETWLADGGAARFAQASARTYARVTAPGGPALTAWYPELAATTRAWVDTPRCAPAPPPPRWLTLSSQGTRNLGRFQA